MKHSSLLSIAGGLLCGAALVLMIPSRLLFVSEAAQTAGASAAGGERWACAMLDYIGNAPGDCPVCGMKLARVTAGELNAEQARRMGLETEVLGRGPAVATVRAYGTVRYDDREARLVLPRVQGRILHRHDAVLHAGTQVRRGEALLDLYSPEVFSAQAELAAAARLDNPSARQALRERFQRWNLEDLAEAVLAGAAPSDTVTLRSPFDGRVLPVGSGMNPRLPEVGEEIMADQPLFRVVDPEAFMLILQVPETRARWLRTGQAVALSSDDLGELPELEARVAWLAPELNAALRTREVHVHLRDPRGRLLPGSLVNARIQVALDAALQPADPQQPAEWGHFVLAPKEAVLSTGVRNVVWKLVERTREGRLRFALAPVTLGPRLENKGGREFLVVTRGLSEGDEIATQAAFLIDSQAQLAGTPSLLNPGGATPAPAGHQH